MEDKLETLEELNKLSCREYGGNNCVLHQCMFECALAKAKERAKNYRFDMKGMAMEYQPHDPVEKYYFTGTINKGVLENLTKK